MRAYVYSLMTDKRNGPVANSLKAVLYLSSLIYGLAILIRSLFYRLGIFKTCKAPMMVVSVGNLTLGGTGKTPFVIALANILKNELHKEVSVLIRGYGWDEQAMLKRNLPDVPILVGEDRVRSSGRAIKLYSSDAAVLDDGFQHWELARDLNIVLIDSRNPFGNGRLFPRGILREPKNAVKRADIVVFTKVNKAISDIGQMARELSKIRSDILFLEAYHAPKYLYNIKTNNAFDSSHAKAKRAVLLSSIGDPSYFEDTVKDIGANVIMHIAFPDHHNYIKKDIDKILKMCGERKLDLIVTTEKDAVKLKRLGLGLKDYPIIALAIEMNISRGKEELIARLRSLYNS